jgi:hypothetical protein
MHGVLPATSSSLSPSGGGVPWENPAPGSNTRQSQAGLDTYRNGPTQMISWVDTISWFPNYLKEGNYSRKTKIVFHSFLRSTCICRIASISGTAWRCFVALWLLYQVAQSDGNMNQTLICGATLKPGKDQVNRTACKDKKDKHWMRILLTWLQFPNSSLQYITISRSLKVEPYLTLRQEGIIAKLMWIRCPEGPSRKASRSPTSPCWIAVLCWWAIGGVPAPENHCITWHQSFPSQLKPLWLIRGR